MTREQNDKDRVRLLDAMDTVETEGISGVAQAYRANCDVEKAHIEHETKVVEMEAQKEIAKKQRIVDYIKIGVYAILGLLGTGVAVWNTLFVSREEHGKNPENEAILFRSKAFGNGKTPNITMPRL